MRKMTIVGLAAFLMAGCGGSENKPAGETPSGVPLAIGPAKQATPGAQPAKSGKIDDFAPAVRQLLQKANAAVVAGRYPTAIEAMSQAIGITPEDARLFRIRADIYSLQKENANARADFSTAIRLAPEDANLYNYRGYFLMSMGLGKEAMEDFNKAISLDAKNSAALNNRGLMKLAGEDYAAAEADFAKAIEADRKFADAWNNRGFVRMKQKQLDSAMSDIQMAVQLNEKYVTAWNNCGLIALEQQKYDEAAKAFSRAVELDPMDVRWLNHRRAALIKMNRFTEAQADASRIEWLAGLAALTEEAGRNARNPKVWLNRGNHLMNGKAYGAAIQDFTRALVVNPGNADALAARAKAWIGTGDYQKAMLDCDESIVVRPSPETYSIRGDIWMKLENLDQAISDFEAAKRFDEQVAVAYETRAGKHKEAGETEAADSDMARAKEIRTALEDKPKEEKPANVAEGFDPTKG